MTSKQTEKVKKNDKWVILVADVYAHILQCYRLILHTFSEKKYIDISSESTVSLLFIYSELQVWFSCNFDSKMRHRMADIFGFMK